MKQLKSNISIFLLAVTFLLGSYKGYLALWADGDPEPKQVFPCPISSLPASDQEALEKGIYVGTKDGLSRYLEDYLS